MAVTTIVITIQKMKYQDWRNGLAVRGCRTARMRCIPIVDQRMFWRSSRNRLTIETFLSIKRCLKRVRYTEEDDEWCVDTHVFFGEE
jgi:hypothetical protein